MIVATKKCSCPPQSKSEKPPYSPCCASDNTKVVKRTSYGKCPVGSCCKKRVGKPVSPPRIEGPPPCCPIMPSADTEFERSEGLRSEIAERGIPYKEIEAVINNNRVVIRTQKEITPAEYDPPCDCKENSETSGQRAVKEIDNGQPIGNRTVTLYPRSKQLDSDEDDENSKNLQEQTADDVDKEALKNIEENPNIFLLRVKNSNVSGDKRFNIDLEFRTPRPWSSQKRMEIENIGKSVNVKIGETVGSKDPAKEDGKKDQQSVKKKKKKKK